MTPPEEIACYLKLARFYISASEFEGRSNSILEAFAAGGAGFASNIEAHREIIEQGKTGFLFAVNAIDALAQQIKQIDRQQDLYESVAAAAQNFASQFTWERTAQEYMQLY